MTKFDLLVVNQLMEVGRQLITAWQAMDGYLDSLDVDLDPTSGNRGQLIRLIRHISPGISRKELECTRFIQFIHFTFILTYL